VGLPGPPVAVDDDTNVDPVTDAQPNSGATKATGRWNTDDDAKLTSAVANTSKKKWGNEYKIDWDIVAALVPGRTNKTCSDRWRNGLNPSIALMAGRTGRWAQDEDSKLENAVQMHGDNDWVATTALVPGRTKRQCRKRWQDVLDASIERTRTGRWAEDEDSKLKDAVQLRGNKIWVTVAAHVPGRTKKQCWSRWHNALNPSIALTPGRTGKWAEDEDSKLKCAVQMHYGKDWAAITALVPGRSRKQCKERWKKVCWIPASIRNRILV
jgi:hypothetical protein